MGSGLPSGCYQENMMHEILDKMKYIVADYERHHEKGCILDAKISF